MCGDFSDSHHAYLGSCLLANSIDTRRIAWAFVVYVSVPPLFYVQASDALSPASAWIGVCHGVKSGTP